MELIEQLQSSRRIFLESVADIDEESAKRKPESGWSVLECVEHCAGAERGMLMMISKLATAAVATGDRSGIASFIDAYGTHRDTRTEAPEAAKPKGRYETLALALARFKEARDRTIAYVEQADEDLDGRMLDHPVMGRITVRECLRLMAQHAIRHAAQIREIRS